MGRWHGHPQLHHMDDMVEAIYPLTQSDLEGAVNLGGDEYVTVAELAQTIIAISGKDVGIEYVAGPVGVQARNFSKARSRALNRKVQTSLREGIMETYRWIAEQVKAAQAAK